MRRFQEIFAQHKTDAVFKKAVTSLDVSKGLPTLRVEASASGDPRMAFYLKSLKRADSLANIVADQPQAVFYGEVHTPPADHMLFVSEFRSRRTPPFTSCAIQLGEDIRTPAPEATIAHVARLAAAQCQVPPDESQKRIEGALDKLRSWRSPSNVTQFALGPAWQFRAVIPADNVVRAFMIPVEQPHFSEDWIKRHVKRVEDAAQPERVADAVEEAALTNYRVARAPIVDVNTFDAGGLERVQDAIAALGWQPVTDPETKRVLGKRTINPPHVYQLPQESDDVPFLGLEEYGPGLGGRSTSTILYGVVSPALETRLRREFAARYEYAVEVVAAALLHPDSSAAEGETVDLSPRRLTDAALEQLGQVLPDYDRHTEARFLGTIAVNVLIDQLRSRDLDDTAQQLADVRRAARKAEKLSGGALRSGWHPENVTLRIPAASLQK